MAETESKSDKKAAAVDDTPFAETQIGPDGKRQPTAELQKDNPDYQDAMKAQKAMAKERDEDEIPDTRAKGDDAVEALQSEQGQNRSGDHSTGTPPKPARGQHNPGR